MNIAVLFAGGVGSRMNSKDLPKQFLMIHGKPILVHTISVFQECSEVDAIVIACHPDWINYCNSLVVKHGLSKVKNIVSGGVTGQQSIYNGLSAVKDIALADGRYEDTIVLIHDGVRPLIKNQTILDNIKSVSEYGSAITSVRTKETVIEVATNEMVERIAPRAQVRLARAPQSFYLKDILEAHEDAIAQGRIDYIDSASMMIDRGFKLHLVEGPQENIKVTTPDDFFAMRAILEARENEQIYLP